MISVDKWNSLKEYDQEEYIKQNDIDIHYTHNIANELTRGFGKLDYNGFWEYKCKEI